MPAVLQYGGKSTEAAMPVMARNRSLEVFVVGVLNEKLNRTKTAVLKCLLVAQSVDY